MNITELGLAFVGNFIMAIRSFFFFTKDPGMNSAHFDVHLAEITCLKATEAWRYMSPHN